MKVPKDWTLVTCYAQSASGPGWANAPVWCIWRTREGDLKETAIQPHEQTNPIHGLYAICAVAHGSLMKAVEAARRNGRLSL